MIKRLDNSRQREKEAIIGQYYWWRKDREGEKLRPSKDYPTTLRTIQGRMTNQVM
jgi:hypothetical protein